MEREAWLAVADQLQINGIDVFCVIGDLPEERNKEQRLTVDVTLFLDLHSAGQSDALSDTVDYPSLADRIRVELCAARCQMIERAAALVARICLSDQRVQAARVRVEKAGAVSGIHHAAVQLTRFQKDERGDGYA